MSSGTYPRIRKKPQHWSPKEVGVWLRSKGHDPDVTSKMTETHGIDGRALLLLTESDLRDVIGVRMLGPLKNLHYDILSLQRSRKYKKSVSPSSTCSSSSSSPTVSPEVSDGEGTETDVGEKELQQKSHHREHGSFDGVPARRTVHARNLHPEVFKTLVAMFYLFVVTWITALVMVIVHDRVPDMEK